jgi:signal transduction histidine kinase
MSKQMTSNRFNNPGRRNLVIAGSKSDLRNAASAAGAHANSTREPSGGAAETPTWLRRRGVHARDDLNSQVVTVLAHELRNSLCIIRMATGILNMEVSAGPAVVRARTLIEHQTAHMSRLVEDLLDTSRAHSRDLALKCETVNLCAIAEQALHSVEFTMQRSRHCMTVSLPVEPLWLQGDPARLEQVFVNLLINAAKYTPSGGIVRLSVERQAGEAVVRVCDNGIGIAADVLPRVFELFVQADPVACRGDAGLGIGLALVRNLVDRHGGCVTAASSGLGQGSEFEVRLPMSVHSS